MSNANKNTAAQTAIQIRQAIAGGNQDLANTIAIGWVYKNDTLYFASRAAQCRMTRLGRQGITVRGATWGKHPEIR